MWNPLRFFTRKEVRQINLDEKRIWRPDSNQQEIVVARQKLQVAYEARQKLAYMDDEIRRVDDEIRRAEDGICDANLDLLQAEKREALIYIKRKFICYANILRHYGDSISFRIDRPSDRPKKLRIELSIKLHRNSYIGLTDADIMKGVGQTLNLKLSDAIHSMVNEIDQRDFFQNDYSIQELDAYVSYVEFIITRQRKPYFKLEVFDDFGM